MCGGHYKHWETPRHLSVVKGEELVARTIRLLRENGVEDIAISTHNPVFEKFGVPILKHDNLYEARFWTIEEGNWFNCFYPTDEPVCYIFGDVFFSDEAIKTIVETETNDIEFFGSRSPFSKNYIKDHEEPFALKVENQKHLRKAIEKTKQLEKQGKFWRKPLMWELWTVIKETPLQTKKGEYPAEYTVINDYTCDIDWKEDIRKIEYKLGGKDMMVKCEVIKDFTLGRFGELKNIKRRMYEEQGKLFVGDTFECTKEVADYLMGNNSKSETVVKVIEITPEQSKEEPKKVEFEEVKISTIEEKPKKTVKKTTKKKTSKKQV